MCQTSIYTSLKTSGTKSFGVMRPKLNFMVTTINAIFGEESSRPMMKSTLSLLWSTEVDVWCLGCLWATSGSGNLVCIDVKMNAAYYVQVLKHSLIISWKLHMGHTWTLNMTVIQNTRPSQPFSGCDRTKWRLWSGHHSLLTSVSLSQYAEISNSTRQAAMTERETQLFPYSCLFVIIALFLHFSFIHINWVISLFYVFFLLSSLVCFCSCCSSVLTDTHGNPITMLCRPPNP